MYIYIHVQSDSIAIYVPCPDWVGGGNVFLLLNCGRASWERVFDTAVGLEDAFAVFPENRRE